MPVRRLMQRTLWLVAASALLLAVAPGRAQTGQAELGQVQPGEAQIAQPTLIAKRDIDIVSSPRNGLFCLRGGEIAELKAGAEVTSYEKLDSYCGLFLKFPYLKISVKRSDGKTVTGYVHSVNDDGTPRFLVRMP